MTESESNIMSTEYRFPRISAATLIVANMIPLMGVLFGGWKVYDILVVFWFENVIVGLYNIARIACVEFNYPTMKLNADEKRRRKIMMAVSFPFHYGMFVAAHGVMIFMGFRDFLGGGNLSDNKTWLMLTLGGLVLSHGVSFFYNYLGRGEFRNIDDETLILGPYGRIVVMQVTIIMGGIPVEITGSPIGLLVLLVIVKIAVDLYAHTSERKKFLKLAAMKEQPPKKKSFLILPPRRRTPKRHSDRRN